MCDGDLGQRAGCRPSSGVVGCDVGRLALRHALHEPEVEDVVHAAVPAQLHLQSTVLCWCLNFNPSIDYSKHRAGVELGRVKENSHC